MPALITDPALQEQLIAQRAAWGADHHDEVWEGVYIMPPLPNDEHQGIITGFVAAFYDAVQRRGLGVVRPGVNVSDRTKDWKENYRCPDVVVFLTGTGAENHISYWYGGPDLAIEIISANDKSREKLEFYGKVGTRELLLIDRDPWQLEIYRLDGDAMKLSGISTLEEPKPLASDVVGCTFFLRLADEDSGEERPVIHVVHAETGKSWDV